MPAKPKPTREGKAEVVYTPPEKLYANAKPKPEPKPKKTPQGIKQKSDKTKFIQKDVKALPAANRQQLEHMLDELCSKFIIGSTRHCITCGTQNGLTCSHYLDRRFMLVRWDLDNLACQCASCNSKHDTFKTPYREYLIREVGEAKVKWLESEEAKAVKKWTEQELLEMVKEMRFALAQIK